MIDITDADPMLRTGVALLYEMNALLHKLYSVSDAFVEHGAPFGLKAIAPVDREAIEDVCEINRNRIYAVLGEQLFQEACYDE